jgi:16S rRNA (cytosine967-C5)-methyltransferase
MLRVIVACTEAEARPVEGVAVRAYLEARDRGWPFLSDVLERAAKTVAETDRGALAALVHALAKYDRLLAFCVPSPEPAARLDALWSLARGRSAEVEARIAAIEAPATRLGVRFSFPDWMVEWLGGELGEARLEAALAWMNEPAPRTLRVNTLKTDRAACLARLAREGASARPTALASQGLTLEGPSSLFRTASYADGDIEVQDEASQLVAEIVAPPPHGLVVDACAGAGGKTLALAALLGGKGHVVAVDASEGRLAELRRRARRAGASNVRALAVDLLAPGDTLRELEGRASRVLLDAPCSGLGALRRNPEARWRLRPDDGPRLTRTQRDLARAAARLVAPHGRLVLATCSFLPSEGERWVESFLADEPDFARVTVRDVLGRARSAAFTGANGVYLQTPGWSRGEAASDPTGASDPDGFFAAVLRRGSAKA